MERVFTKYGGDRPMFTQPPLQVTGGFTLDVSQKNLAAGSVIPFGTLACVDEAKRTAVLIKSARVVAIAGDTKLVTLESDEFSQPLFVVGDLVHSKLGATFTEAPKIDAITMTEDGMQLKLNKAISGLAVGNALFEVKDSSSKTALKAVPNAITIGNGYPCAEVKKELTDTQIDVSRNSGNGEIYARRVPPVPADLMEGNVLKGTKVAYTNSF